MKNIKIIVITAAITVLGANFSYAHEKDMSDAMAAYVARDGMMHLIGAQRGIMRDIASGKTPMNQAEFVRAANSLAYMFSMIPSTFEKNLTVKESRAKPEIWQNWDNFVEVADNLRKVTAEIAAVAEIRGVAAVKDRIGEIDCGSCHTPYRK